MTLEKIIKDEKKRRQERGMFGIQACKESIEFDINDIIIMFRNYHIKMYRNQV